MRAFNEVQIMKIDGEKLKQIELAGYPSHLFQGIICVDISKSMEPLLNELRNEIHTFFQRFNDGMEDMGYYAGLVLVRILTFSNKDENVPITLSDYFYLPLEIDGLTKYVKEIKTIGNSHKRDCLSAIEAAIKSDWVDVNSFDEALFDKDYLRHRSKRQIQFIVMLSDGEPKPFDGYNVEETIKELLNLWEEENGIFVPIKSRMVAFVPSFDTWVNFFNKANRTWPTYLEQYKGLSDVYFQDIIDLSIGSF